MNERQGDAGGEIGPVKDPQRSHPVAAAWRPTFQDIVRALANGDFGIKSGIPLVEAVDEATMKQIHAYIVEYGQTLAHLPEETWNSSVSQWMGGSYWDVLVDLWTVEAGRSDLVLSARVFEEGHGYRIRVEGVYVP